MGFGPTVAFGKTPDTKQLGQSPVEKHEVEPKLGHQTVGFTKLLTAGRVSMPPAPNVYGEYGTVIPLGGNYPRENVIVLVGQVSGGMIPVMTDTTANPLYAVQDGNGVPYYEYNGTNAKGYPVFTQHVIPQYNPNYGVYDKWVLHAAESNYVSFRPETDTISEVLISATMMHLIGSDYQPTGYTLYTLGDYGIPDASYVVLLKEE
jgi:hypothetical protein